MTKKEKLKKWVDERKETIKIVGSSIATAVVVGGYLVLKNKYDLLKIENGLNKARDEKCLIFCDPDAEDPRAPISTDEWIKVCERIKNK